MRYRVRWSDGHEVEVEAEKVKAARWKAVDQRRAEGYITDDDERRRLDVQAVRDTEHDVCEVLPAREGDGWWIIVAEKWRHDYELTPTATLPCPHCQKPVHVTQNENPALPGKPFVLWEFRRRDDAEALCTIANTMIMVAAMGNVIEDEKDAA